MAKKVKCHKCQADVVVGLIRCGNCGTPTEAMTTHKTSDVSCLTDKLVPLSAYASDRKTTKLKKNDRSPRGGLLHGFNPDSGHIGREDEDGEEYGRGKLSEGSSKLHWGDQPNPLKQRKRH